MRWWRIEWWDGTSWRPCDVARSRGEGELLLRSYAEKGKFRYRLLNPDSKVVLHKGIVEDRRPI